MAVKFWRNPIRWLGEKLAPRKPPVIPSEKQVEPVKVPTKRRRVVRHIVRNTPMADREAVEHHVEYMDNEELDETLRMNMTQIQAKAKLGGDRMIVKQLGQKVPLNPWWYHPWT